MGQDQSGAIAIVTVHGTGDTAVADAGDKWFQQGSAFSEALRARLAQAGLQAEIKPHLWTGANSAWDREQAANALAARIRKLYKHFDTIHVIGHSHGGNVANDAAVLLKWGLRTNAERDWFDSLTTVGTPFFNVRTGWPQVLAGILILLVAWGSVFLYPFTSLFFGAVGGPVLFVVSAVVLGPSIAFMFETSRQGARRALRRRVPQSKSSIFSIWHENDEAISFLRRVEDLQFEPFRSGALYRGSRTMAIGFAVMIVLGVVLANALLLCFYFSGYDLPGNTFALAIICLLFAPAIFTAAYFLYRFVIGGLQELLARGPLNGFVGAVLRGIAMGRDGDQVLCHVGPRSHTHPSEDLILSGACAARMQQNANGAAGALIDKYRWALFSVGGDSSASLTALTTDAMTWESLIHTTYFDQPEVVEAIASHIAAKARGA